MSYDNTQAKPGTPRVVSTNKTNRTGRPDHPAILDGDAGSITDNYPRTTAGNPTAKGGRSVPSQLQGPEGRRNTGYVYLDGEGKSVTDASAGRVKKIGG